MLNAQTVLFEEPFNEDTLPAGWTATDQAGNMTTWRWTNNGQASQGQFWNNRPSIDSDSGEGAFMFDSDGQHFADPTISFPDNAVLTTSTIDVSTSEEVWLQFYQYYRNAFSNTFVGVSSDAGNTWTDIQINQEIGFGIETSNSSQVKLNITDLVLGSTEVQIRFIFEGANYFWIIDDVELVEPENNDPVDPEYPNTFPAELGDSLTAWGIPYEVDALGGAYPPNELVVRWVPGTSETDKQELRDSMGIIRFDTCNCSDLELFVFPNELSLADSANLVVNGDFENGNADFTSGLVEDCTCESDSYCISEEFADKCVSFNPFNFSGNGKFMIVDGPANTGADIWCQQINLTANEEYIFAFRGRSGQAFNLPDLQLYFGTNSSGQPVQSVSEVGDWAYYFFTYKTTTGGMTDVCLRQENFGFSSYDYALDDLFLAELDGVMNVYQDSVENKKEKAEAMPGKIEETEFNYYNFDIEELKDTTPVVGQPVFLPEAPNQAEPDDLVIAILDTGVDYIYQHPTPIGNFEIRPYMYRDPDFTTCYPGDYQGWNFVELNSPFFQNRPFDDHGHGSHVAGIVIQQWEELMANAPVDDCCQLRILPVKTHDFHGLGKLFDVSCGIIYATEMGADVINASWGFTAVQDTSSGILHYAIEYASLSPKEVLVVTSAGNSNVDIDAPLGDPATPNYPSNYFLDNIVTVAAMDALNDRWSFSNFSTTKVDFAAPGENIGSIIPIGTDVGNPISVWQNKSGTSMSAPVIAAYAGLLSCMDNAGGAQQKVDKLYELSVPISSTAVNWDTLINSGNTFEPVTFLSGIDFENCVVGTNEVISDGSEWKVFPNPTTNDLQVRVVNNQIPLQSLRLWNAQGQLLFEQRLDPFSPNIDLRISLSNYPTGMYHLSLLSETGMLTQSIIKMD
jgi:hypothetical protein